MKAIANSSHVSMSPSDDQVYRDPTMHHALVDQTGCRSVALRKSLRNRLRAGLGIICAVALGSLITLIGGFPDEDPWSPY